LYKKATVCVACPLGKLTTLARGSPALRLLFLSIASFLISIESLVRLIVKLASQLLQKKCMLLYVCKSASQTEMKNRRHPQGCPKGKN